MCVGSICVVAGIAAWLRINRWKSFAVAMLLVCAVPAAGLLLGAYYLVKALL